MPTLPVHVVLPTGARIPGELSTDHSSASYNWPVLLLEGNPYGPHDALDPAWGESMLVAEAAVEAAGEGDTGLLGAWVSMCRVQLARKIARGHFAADQRELGRGESLRTREPVAWMTGTSTIQDDAGPHYRGDLSQLASLVRHSYRELVAKLGGGE